MHKLKFTFVFLLLSVMTFAQYNNRPLPEKQTQAEKLKPKPWGGYLTIQGGYSPSHPDVFLGTTLAVSRNYVQLSATVVTACNNVNTTLCNAMLGYRYAASKYLTLIPKAGVYQLTDEHTAMQWSEGDHLCYAFELEARTEGNISFTFEGVDYRMLHNGARKQLTAGVKYHF